MTAAVTLRPAFPEDDAFQQAVFASTRADELALAGWSHDQEEAFIKMQFNAQRQHYRAQYPQAEWSIVMRENEPVGRMIVDRSGGALHLMDIALLPEHRGTGIGTTLIRALIEEACRSGLPVHLYVDANNPAQALYRRLGFTPVSDAGIRFEMEWQPGLKREVYPQR